MLAYQWGASFELCRVLSGNSNAIDLTINIDEGPYTGTSVINGVHHPIQHSFTTYLPAGSYQLLLLGIDWGGPAEFDVEVNNRRHNLPYTSNGDGLLFNPGPISFNVE